METKYPIISFALGSRDTRGKLLCVARRGVINLYDDRGCVVSSVAAFAWKNLPRVDIALSRTISQIIILFTHVTIMMKVTRLNKSGESSFIVWSKLHSFAIIITSIYNFGYFRSYRWMVLGKFNIEFKNIKKKTVDGL